MADLLVDLAFVFGAGVLATGHCAGMCGGLITAYSLRSGEACRGLSPLHGKRLLPHLLYNAGRVGSYVLLGGIIGWVGSFIEVGSTLAGLKGVPHLLFGSAMILFGLDALGVMPLLGGQAGSKGGAGGWILARAGKLLGDHGSSRVFALGMLTALLPCSLHWAFQAKAAATGSVWGGMGVMLAFGLGTMGPLMGLGLFASALGVTSRRWLMWGAGVTVLVMGGMVLRRGIMLF
ncbi:MAG: sulfite exporter TauE/SafE family protein [Magnetococcales bacterium]|nr:sulfite exporter TauE/SafE family protein [Magnetococcales bacterium]